MPTQCQSCPKVSASLAKFCQSSAQVILKLFPGIAHCVPKWSPVMSCCTYKVYMQPADESSDYFWYICSGSESVIEDRCDLKKWVGWWIICRSGWLLELLTELKRVSFWNCNIIKSYTFQKKYPPDRKMDQLSPKSAKLSNHLDAYNGFQYI